MARIVHHPNPLAVSARGAAASPCVVPARLAPRGVRVRCVSVARATGDSLRAVLASPSDRPRPQLREQCDGQRQDSATASTASSATSSAAVSAASSATSSVTSSATSSPSAPWVFRPDNRGYDWLWCPGDGHRASRRANPHPVVRLDIQWSTSGGQGSYTASGSGIQWLL